MIDKFNDECGVFGIYGHPEAANLAYLGLYALQHRGQESAGIARRDGDRRCSRRWATSPTFNEAALERCRRRWPSATSATRRPGRPLANAQPILIDCAPAQIAIAHNGNLVNARELRDELDAQGSIFQTTSDTEVILHLIARSRPRR